MVDVRAASDAAVARFMASRKSALRYETIEGIETSVDIVPVLLSVLAGRARERAAMEPADASLT